MVGVRVAKSQLSSGSIVVQITVQPKSEQGIWALFRVIEDLVHRLGDLVDGDGVPAHAKDAVELGFLNERR